MELNTGQCDIMCFEVVFFLNELSKQDEKFNRAPSVSVTTVAAPTTCLSARSS